MNKFYNDIGNDYYSNHVGRFVRKQNSLLNEINAKFIHSLNDVFSNLDYKNVFNNILKESMELKKFQDKEINNMSLKKFSINLKELGLLNFENYISYLKLYLMDIDYIGNENKIKMLLFTCNYNLVHGYGRADYIINDQATHVMLFDHSECYWNKKLCSFEEFLNDSVCVYSLKEVIYEINRNNLLDTIDKSIEVLLILINSKDLIKEKLLLVVNELVILKSLHNKELFSAYKAFKEEPVFTYGLIIEDLLNLLNYDFIIYTFNNLDEIMDGINWILDEIEILKYKFYKYL